MSMLLLWLGLVQPFPLQGLWALKGVEQHQPLFQIGQDRIVSSMSKGAVSMTPTLIEFMPHNNTVMMVLQQPQVERKPSDWYNVVKYSTFIRYFHKIQKHGMVIWCQILNDNEMIISGSIGDEYWQSCCNLTRQEKN